MPGFWAGALRHVVRQSVDEQFQLRRVRKDLLRCRDVPGRLVQVPKRHANAMQWDVYQHGDRRQQLRSLQQRVREWPVRQRPLRLPQRPDELQRNLRRHVEQSEQLRQLRALLRLQRQHKQLRSVRIRDLSAVPASNRRTAHAAAPHRHGAWRLLRDAQCNLGGGHQLADRQRDRGRYRLHRGGHGSGLVECVYGGGSGDFLSPIGRNSECCQVAAHDGHTADQLERACRRSPGLASLTAARRLCAAIGPGNPVERRPGTTLPAAPRHRGA